MNDYYFDELLAMMDEYSAIHSIDSDGSREVYADEMDMEFWPISTQ